MFFYKRILMKIINIFLITFMFFLNCSARGLLENSSTLSPVSHFLSINPDNDCDMPGFYMEMDAHKIDGHHTPFWVQIQLAAGYFAKHSNTLIAKDILKEDFEALFKNHNLIADNLSLKDELLDTLLQKLMENGLISGSSSKGYRANKNSSAMKIWASDYIGIKNDIEKSINSEKKMIKIFSDFAKTSESLKKYPTEANLAVLQAVLMLDADDFGKLFKFINKLKDDNHKLFKTPLINSIILMADKNLKRRFKEVDIEIAQDWENMGESEESEREFLEKVAKLNQDVIKEFFGDDWVSIFAPRVRGTIWEVTPEGQDVAGGLGRVEQYHPLAMNALGGKVSYIEPYYRESKLHPGKKTDYTVHKATEEFAGVAVRVKNIKLVHNVFVNLSGENAVVEAEIYRGINERGIPVYLIRDKEGKYVREMFKYNTDGHSTQQDFSEFFTKAAWEFIKLKENENKRILESKGAKWDKPVINCNDAQSLLLPVWRVAEMLKINDSLLRGIDKFGHKLTQEEINKKKEELKYLTKLVMMATTHTYKNRDFIGNRHDYEHYWKQKFIKMGLPEGLHWLFIADGYHGQLNLTSAGLRCAEIAKSVASIHNFEVQEYDPNIDLIGISNGDDINSSTRRLQEIMKDFQIKKDIDKLDKDEVARVKRKAREMNQTEQLLVLSKEIKELYLSLAKKIGESGLSDYLVFLKAQVWDIEEIKRVERLIYLYEQEKAFKEYNPDLKRIQMLSFMEMFSVMM